MSRIIVTAIIAIAALEAIALFQGIDGQLFTFVLVVLAGLAGLKMKTPKWLGK